MSRLNSICKAAEVYGSDPTQYLPCEICEPCLPRTCCQYVTKSASGNDLIVGFDNTVPSDLLSCIDSGSPAVMTKLDVYFDECPEGTPGTPDYTFNITALSTVTIIGGNLEECICLVFYEGSTEVMRCAFSPASCVSDTYNTTAGNITVSTNLTNGVTVLGTNTLTLTGNNTFTCQIIIADASTLSVSTSSNLGSNTNSIYFLGGGIKITGTSLHSFGSHTVYFAANSDVRINIEDASNTFTISAVMNQGTGGLIKTGLGKLSLDNANTYSGTTLVSAGTLRLGNNYAVQSSTVNLNTGALNFATGITAPVLGGLSGSTNIALTTDTAQNVALSVGNNNASTTYSGVLSAAGSLVKVGAGIFTLTGNSTYAGVTTISEGVLRLGNAGTTGSIGGSSIVNTSASTIFEISRSDNIVQGIAFPVITGAGGFTMSFSGDVEFPYNNTYTGPTTICCSTLLISGTGHLNGGSYGGAIILSSVGARLNYAGSLTQILFGSISGSGGVTMSGTNILTISSHCTYTGDTHVTDGNGTLFLDSGTIVGHTYVHDGCTLRGSNALFGGITVYDGGTLKMGTVDDPTSLDAMTGDLNLYHDSLFESRIRIDDSYLSGGSARNYIAQCANINILNGALLDISVSVVSGDISTYYNEPLILIGCTGIQNGIFIGIANASYFEMHGIWFYISYKGIDPINDPMNDVYIAIVATPASGVSYPAAPTAPPWPLSP